MEIVWPTGPRAKFGPVFVLLVSTDMLLKMNRPQATLSEYEKSLQTDPNRFNDLYGATRSAELLERSPSRRGHRLRPIDR